MSNAIQHNDQNFEEFVKSSDIPVPVGIFRFIVRSLQFAPTVEELATELCRVNVCKVDIDESPLSAQKMGVKGVFAVNTFKSVEKTGSVICLTSKDKLRVLVE